MFMKVYDYRGLIVNIQYQMYKVNVASAYFQNSLKVSSESKNNKSKAKFSLTDLQKEFIESKLPRGCKLVVACESDEKRNRAPKKKDSMFETQQKKRDHGKDTSDKKLEKVKEGKTNQKPHQTPIKQASFKLVVPTIETALSSLEQESTKKAEAERKQPIKETAMEKSKQLGKIQQRASTFSMVQQVPIVVSSPRNQHQPIKTPAVLITSQQKELSKTNQTVATVKNTKQESLQAVAPKQTKPGEFMSNEQKQFCTRFLGKLKAHKSSWPFRQPVDPINQGVPDYLQVIHEPMDLRTIEKKLNSSKYEHAAEFHGDVNKIFLNSYKFNPRETNYYALTIELENYYHELLKEVESNPNVLENDRHNRNMRAKLTTKSEQQFVEEEHANKKAKLVHSPSMKIGNEDQILPNSEVKQKAHQSLLKSNKSQNLKLKSKTMESERIDRKQLIKKAERLSSRALEDIINVAFGQIDEERTSFALDFEKLSESIISKIRDIVQMDLKQCKSTPFSIESRLLLF